MSDMTMWLFITNAVLVFCAGAVIISRQNYIERMAEQNSTSILKIAEALVRFYKQGAGL